MAPKKNPPPAPAFNVREKMAQIANWLGNQHEDLSFGLKSIADAEKLYDAHCRDAEDTYPDERAPRWRTKILGYDPLKRALDIA